MTVTGPKALRTIRSFRREPPEHGVNSVLQRTENDLCVYVLKPGDTSKRMVVVNPAGSWADFLKSIGDKLNVNVLRVFNKRDEMKKISDLSQGDILAIQHGSPVSTHIKEPGKLLQHAAVHWAKLCRLITLQCLDEFVVTEVLNSGRNHETLRARRKKDNFSVVIKRFAAGSGPRDVSESTLRSYICLCSSVRHPRFANYVDMFISFNSRHPGTASRPLHTQPAVLTLIMERYETNLESYFEQRLKLQNPITSPEIVSYVTQILNFLQYLHFDLHTIHRNIKMSNCLLDKRGNIFLSDLAVPAVNASANAHHMRSTCRNSVARRRGLLTPKLLYCSPEAFASGRTSDKDDVWAVGCILSELVTHKPVPDRTPHEIFGRSLGAIAQAVAEAESRDSALGALCRVLLDPDPTKRPTPQEALHRHMRAVYPEAHAHDPPARLTARESAVTSVLSRTNDVPTLVTALLRNDFPPGMEAAALRLNEILTAEPSKRASLRDAFATPVGRMTGLAALAFCLLRGSPAAQQLAAAALRTAMLDDANERCLSRDDVASLVAAVLAGGPATQANAAAALANACCSCPHARDAVHAAGGVGALVALVAVASAGPGGPGPCLAEAAAAIRNACIAHEGNREDVMRAGGIGALVGALRGLCGGGDGGGGVRRVGRAAAAMEHVLGALRNACNRHTGNCVRLAEAEGVAHAVGLLAQAPAAVQEQAAGLVRNACVGHCGNKHQLGACGGLWSFAQLLGQPGATPALREEAISAVRYCAVGHRANCHALGEVGLIRALVAVLVPGPLEGTMRAKEEAAAALRVACEGARSAANCAEVFESGGVATLLDLAARGSRLAREEAVAAAAAACGGCALNLDQLVGQPARLQAVRALMADPDMPDEARFFARCLLVLVDHRLSRSLGPPPPLPARPAPAAPAGCSPGDAADGASADAAAAIASASWPDRHGLRGAMHAAGAEGGHRAAALGQQAVRDGLVHFPSASRPAPFPGKLTPRGSDLDGGAFAAPAPAAPAGAGLGEWESYRSEGRGWTEDALLQWVTADPVAALRASCPLPPLPANGQALNPAAAGHGVHGGNGGGRLSPQRARGGGRVGFRSAAAAAAAGPQALPRWPGPRGLEVSCTVCPRGEPQGRGPRPTWGRAGAQSCPPEAGAGGEVAVAGGGESSLPLLP